MHKTSAPGSTVCFLTAVWRPITPWPVSPPSDAVLRCVSMISSKSTLSSGMVNFCRANTVRWRWCPRTTVGSLQTRRISSGVCCCAVRFASLRSATINCRTSTSKEMFVSFETHRVDIDHVVVDINTQYLDSDAVLLRADAFHVHPVLAVDIARAPALRSRASRGPLRCNNTRPSDAEARFRLPVGNRFFRRSGCFQRRKMSMVETAGFSA